MNESEGEPAQGGERERQEEIRYCQTVAAVGAASTQAPCARESIALTHSILSKWVRWVACWAKGVRVQRGGNSNNPEVFSRSPPGQRGSQDTAKTVRVLCSIHPIAQTPFSLSVSLSATIFIPLLVSASICPFSFHPPASPNVPRSVFSYGLALSVALEPCVRCT